MLCTRLRLLLIRSLRHRGRFGRGARFNLRRVQQNKPARGVDTGSLMCEMKKNFWMTVWLAVREEKAARSGTFLRTAGPYRTHHTGLPQAKRAVLTPPPAKTHGQRSDPSKAVSRTSWLSKLLMLLTGPLRLLVLCRYLRLRRCGLRDHHGRR